MLESLLEIQSGHLWAPSVVVVEDEHRFLSFRTQGVAYCLGNEAADIFVPELGEIEFIKQPALVVPKDGDLYFLPAGE